MGARARMGTVPDSSSCSCGTGLIGRAAADAVLRRQKTACTTAAAVGLGQHLSLGIAPIISLPTSGVQIQGAWGL
eukprot:382452-Pyramimonas_sp.AAC.1